MVALYQSQWAPARVCRRGGGVGGEDGNREHSPTESHRRGQSGAGEKLAHLAHLAHLVKVLNLLNLLNLLKVVNISGTGRGGIFT